MSLESEPFSYQTTKDGRVRIAYRQRVVTTLTGKAAAQFAARIARSDSAGAQQVMAKATGHFQHGNERPAARGRCE